MLAIWIFKFEGIPSNIHYVQDCHLLLKSKWQPSIKRKDTAILPYPTKLKSYCIGFLSNDGLNA